MQFYFTSVAQTVISLETSCGTKVDFRTLFVYVVFFSSVNIFTLRKAENHKSFLSCFTAYQKAFRTVAILPD